MITNQQLRRELAAERRACRLAREELARDNETMKYFYNKHGISQNTANAQRSKYTPKCLTFLKLSAPVTKTVVNKRFHELAKRFHPDKGGSAATFIRLKTALDEALTLCKE